MQPSIHVPYLMRTLPKIFTAVLLSLGITACASTVDQRVSAPQVTLQQLAVGTDGAWTADVRVQNYSNVPMQFSALELTVYISEVDAGRLQQPAALAVGPVSADVTRLRLATPAPAARIAVANALASGGSVGYRLEGSLQGTTDGGRGTRYPIRYEGRLSATPGVVGVLR